MLPIEFARRSADDRITLVIADVEHRVRSLWALLSVPDVWVGRAELGRREGASGSLDRAIGFWSPDESSDRPEVACVAEWAVAKRLDAVVWTALPAGMSKEDPSVPPPDAILGHLRGLDGEKRSRAEVYIRNAPAPIDTPYRRLVAREFGWAPSDLAFTACGQNRART